MTFKKLITMSICAAAITACSSHQGYQSYQAPAYNNPGKFGVGLGVGTTGATVEAKYAPSKTVMLRGSYNYLDFSMDEEFDDIDYDGDFKANTVAGFVDIAPFHNGFIVSGGAYIGDKTLDLNATPTGNVEIGGSTFTSAEVGTLTGQAELRNFAPYAGIGYDSFISGSTDWSFNARAGVMFTGAPKVDLVSANGTLSSDPRLRGELEAEINAIEDDAEDYRYYPVVTVGLTRRF